MRLIPSLQRHQCAQARHRIAHRCLVHKRDFKAMLGPPMYKRNRLHTSHSRSLHLHQSKIRTLLPTPRYHLHHRLLSTQSTQRRPQQCLIIRIHHHIRPHRQTHFLRRLLRHRPKTLRMRLAQMRQHHHVRPQHLLQLRHIAMGRYPRLQQPHICTRRYIQQTQRHTQPAVITSRTLAQRKIALQQLPQPLFYYRFAIAPRNPHHHAR